MPYPGDLKKLQGRDQTMTAQANKIVDKDDLGPKLFEELVEDVDVKSVDESRV